MYDIIRDKLPSSYPNYVKNNISLVTLNKNKSMPIGTLSYAYPIYPSDIDVFEEFTSDSYDKTIDLFEKKLKIKVGEINSLKDYWILEVKVGIDERFNFNTNDPNYEARIILLQKIIPHEFPLLSNDAEYINELLRKYAVLRWKPNEIIAGFKQLADGKIMTLREAIQSKSQINIEIIGIINNKFTDLSNFYVLTYSDNNNLYAINLSQNSITDFKNFFLDNLKKNIKKLYYSKMNRDYYKIIKRYWSYGRFTKDKELINKLLPIINSSIALAGQKRSEISTLIDIVKHLGIGKLPKNIFNNQLGNIKFQIASLITLGFDKIQYINDMIDSLINNTKCTYDIFINKLENIEKILWDFVQDQSFKYLKSKKLAPPPLKFIK